MSRRSKLELTWIGKENRPKLEPRILIEDPDLSYHAPHRVSKDDIFDNRLIFGDNLLALKALEQDFAGKVKCIYIDPPFNTQQAFEHYDDSVEHSTWLSLMRDRLELLRRLLSEDGTLFVHIDDNELAYLITVLDELFGRSNRLYVVTFKQGSATGHKAINPGCVTTSNFVLIYAKDRRKWNPNRIFTARGRDNRYSQFIVNRSEHFRTWKIEPLMQVFADSRHISIREARRLARQQPELLDGFVLSNPDSVIRFARPSYQNVGRETREAIDISTGDPDTIHHLARDGYPDIYLKDGQRILFYSAKLKLIDGEMVAGEPLTTIWDDVLSNNLHKEGGISFPKGKKPEALIQRVIELSTNRGDWVLDSFAGSGTTGAVAHKMGRRWIMVELEDHCHTHVIPRLKRVIDGNDPDGASKVMQWKGGGGFRYYRLGPSLLEKDRYGNWVISKEFNKEMLAEAVCKLEGFAYAPNDEVYWQHGQSTETDFIYVTTQTMTHEMLEQLSDEVGEKRSLVVYCAAFRASQDAFPNLTIKKIPKTVLKKCEWGHDDYSLEIENLPQAPPEPDRDASDEGPKAMRSLFDEGSVE